MSTFASSRETTEGTIYSVTGGDWDQPLNYGFDINLTAVGNVIATGQISTNGQGTSTTSSVVSNVPTTAPNSFSLITMASGSTGVGDGGGAT